MVRNVETVDKGVKENVRKRHHVACVCNFSVRDSVQNAAPQYLGFEPSIDLYYYYYYYYYYLLHSSLTATVSDCLCTSCSPYHPIFRGVEIMCFVISGKCLQLSNRFATTFDFVYITSMSVRPSRLPLCIQLCNNTTLCRQKVKSSNNSRLRSRMIAKHNGT